MWVDDVGRGWVEHRRGPKGLVGPKGGVAARYHCGTAKVEAIPLPLSLSRSIPPSHPTFLSSSLSLFLPSSNRVPFSFSPLTLRLYLSVYIYLFVSLSRFICVARSSRPFRSRTRQAGAIVNGLQPLPGIYPRNLPTALRFLCLSSRALLVPSLGIPRGDLPTALFKQRDTFPSTTSQFSPGRGLICLVFRVTCTLPFPVFRTPFLLSSYLFPISPSPLSILYSFAISMT